MPSLMPIHPPIEVRERAHAWGIFSNAKGQWCGPGLMTRRWGTIGPNKLAVSLDLWESLTPPERANVAGWRLDAPDRFHPPDCPGVLGRCGPYCCQREALDEHFRRWAVAQHFIVPELLTELSDTRHAADAEAKEADELRVQNRALLALVQTLEGGRTDCCVNGCGVQFEVAEDRSCKTCGEPTVLLATASDAQQLHETLFPEDE